MAINYFDGYADAEREIVAWLETQIPVPVCRTLAVKIAGGAARRHAGRPGPEPTRWEIPVKLRDEPDNLEAAQRAIATLSGIIPLGLFALAEDAGLVVMPMIPVVEAQVVKICEMLRALFDVGAPTPLTPKPKLRLQ